MPSKDFLTTEGAKGHSLKRVGKNHFQPTKFSSQFTVYSYNLVPYQNSLTQNRRTPPILSSSFIKFYFTKNLMF